MNSLTHHLTPFLNWLNDSWLGVVTRQYHYLFTACLVIHFIGLSMLMGAMLIVDLRLMGFPRQLPIAAAMKFLPIAIAGFLINLCTGITMVSFDAVDYWLNPAFRVKMLLVLVAGLNALWFTLAEQRKVLSQPSDQRTTIAVRTSAAVSLLVWFAIIYWGRMIVAYQSSASF
ncbi:MAG TPA: DUF6644 family protein [Steroidobacteraceae bacterium]|jgi:hypothetical protein|nr:DUF6644 family protein [Steroidobacteraceae bacterium]